MHQRRKHSLLCLTALLAATVPLAAADSDAAAATQDEGPMGALAPLVGGQWRGQLKLTDGTIIRARHIFEWGLGQTFIRSKTYGAVGDGDERLVYEGFFSLDAAKQRIVFREFSASGAGNEGTIEPNGNVLRYAWSTHGKNGVTEYQETLRFPDKDHYLSEAFEKTGAGWEKFAESSFWREPAPEGEAAQRVLRKEVTLDAPLADVWNAWTTSEGVTTFFGPAAQVEARLGGPFEIYFAPSAPEGLRGSEGCKVQSVVPMQLFAFEWNAPPTIPAIRNSGLHSLVQIRLYEEGPNRTRVAMTHSGWGEGEDWDKTFNYFDAAWDAVLSNLRYRFAVGPVQWPGRFVVAEQQAAEKQ